MKVVVDTNVVISGVFFKGPPYLALLVAQSSIVDPIEPSPAIVTDPDDDKFFACALAGGAVVIVSGDRHLIKTSGYRGVDVLTPRQFLDKFL